LPGLLVDRRTLPIMGAAGDQPMASKHLGVLKQVGLVRERREGRKRLYRVNVEKLKPIHDWVAPFERYWSESFDRLDEVLQVIQEKEK